MKKFNAQAERPSNRAGALRPSPANCGFLEQKHLATGPELHVPHVHFFYLFIDYKHTVNQMELCVVHLPPPSFFYRLQAQAPSTTELTHSMCEIFFYFFYFLDYKHKHAPVQGSSTRQRSHAPRQIFC